MVYGLGMILPLVLRRMAIYPLAGLNAAIAWGIYGAVLMWILYRLELFERRSLKTIAGAFLWGAVVVAGIGVTASPAMAGIVDSILGEGLSGWTSALAAPLTEEPLKMLGVAALAMIPGAHVRTTLDGLFYGLIVGLGFQVTESFLFTVNVAASRGGALEFVYAMVIVRGVIGGLWNHPTFSGVAGAGVGYFVSSPKPLPWRVFVAGGSLAVAMFFHGLFDSPLLAGLDGLGVIIKGIPILVILIVVLVVARRHERERFEFVAAAQIDPDLISEAERHALSSHSRRRRARREARRSGGRRAGRAMRDLQSAQVDLVDAAMDEGVVSPRYREAAGNVAAARRSLG